jgi:hypothetical protein
MRFCKIGGVELVQIPRYTLFQLLAPPLDFRAREILVAIYTALNLLPSIATLASAI